MGRCATTTRSPYLQQRDRSRPGGGPRGGPSTGSAERSLRHPEREQDPAAFGVSLSPVDGTKVADLLDDVATQDDISRRRDLELNPFERHPTARFRWAFERLRGRTGRHLDLGIGDASSSSERSTSTPRSRWSAPTRTPATSLRHVCGTRDLSLVQVGDHLPFADAAFDSVTMLDVLEHTTNERTTLGEVCRVLRPGGMLALTVPAQPRLLLPRPRQCEVPGSPRCTEPSTPLVSAQPRIANVSRTTPTACGGTWPGTGRGTPITTPPTS